MSALDISYSGENIEQTLFLPLQRQFPDEVEKTDQLTKKMNCLDVSLNLNDSLQLLDMTHPTETLKLAKSYVNLDL